MASFSWLCPLITFVRFCSGVFTESTWRSNTESNIQKLYLRFLDVSNIVVKEYTILVKPTKKAH